MRMRLLVAALGLAAVTAAPAAGLTHSTMGTWACAGVEPVAAVCLNNPWDALPR